VSTPLLRALAHGPFRVYFAGQAVSILGSWIQQVALAWLVYRLTGSSLLLGVTAFCALIPQLLVGPLAGAWIDRQNKRLWLMGVQIVLAVQAFLLAVLTWAGWITPELIVVMSLLLGVINSFDMPLRQSLIASFVGRREDLPNALALNAMLFNIGRFIGPPVAGLLLGGTSEAMCFVINGVSFTGLIVGMAWLRGVEPQRARGSMGQLFREGLNYAWNSWTVRTLILTLASRRSVPGLVTVVFSGALAAHVGAGHTLQAEAVLLAVCLSYLWTLRRRMVGEVKTSTQ
jgi:MFS family permease